MDQAFHPVHPWPEAKRLPGPGEELLVLGIATPDTAIRDAARRRTRLALRSVLGELLDLPPERVPLLAEPGQAPRLDLPERRIALSVSHERGLSLAAIHLGSAVGIDLMRSENEPDWEAVARDYLGERTRERIGRLPPAQRPPAFADAWTRLEACRKCLGLALAEWDPALEKALSRCRTHRLRLPRGLAGTVALLS